MYIYNIPTTVDFIWIIIQNTAAGWLPLILMGIFLEDRNY